MTVELQALQAQLQDALSRIAQLEARLENGETTPWR